MLAIRIFDAKYSTRNALTWTDLVTGYEGYGAQLLDLHFNGANINWGEYSSAHEYEYVTTGNGGLASFLIYDTYPSNNSGKLDVDIYAQL